MSPAVPEEAFARLHATTRAWADRRRPADWPRDVPVTRLPPPSYDGDLPYNGFTGAERRRMDQVLIVLCRRGVIVTPECDLCGRTERIQLHAEDYFDPFSAVPVCGGCHSALHHRFRSPDKWTARLDAYADRPHAGDFRALPMTEGDFAAWLRRTTDGPFDPVAAIWGDRDVPGPLPRRTR